MRESKARRRKMIAIWRRDADKFDGRLSCRGIGCIGCCYQMPACGLFEGALIADYLIRSSQFELLAALEEQGRRQYALAGYNPQRLLAENDAISGAWLDQAEPCALLDPETKQCRAYSLRPTTCSTYFSVTPAELCGPPSGRMVGCLDNRAAMAVMMEIDKFFSVAIGLPAQGVVLPLPLGRMVQLGAGVLMHGPDCLRGENLDTGSRAR
jgi:Fe-S-cluster containining protein